MSLAFGPASLHLCPMNEMPTKLKARAERKNAKRDARKRQIAESALAALKELGYANTSLRDIAAKCDLSIGMLHYYFEDRSELITYCVYVYKTEFVRKIIDALHKAEGREQVVDSFADALVASIIDDEMTHRLWYDIRTQAMFDATFRPVVAEIEAMLIDIVRTAFIKAGQEVPEAVEVPYAMLDGLFRYMMQRQIGAAAVDRDALKAVFAATLDRFL